MDNSEQSASDKALEQILARFFGDIRERPKGRRLECSSGALPSALKGHIFHCGPGSYSLGEIAYQHPSDGYGLVSQIVLAGDDPAIFRSRYVETEARSKELATMEERYRSASTLSPEIGQDIDPLSFKNVSNGSVVFHAGKLLTLWEMGMPHMVEPGSLETIGVYDFNGALQNLVSPLDRQLCPHYPIHHRTRVDPESGDLRAFGVMQSVGTRLMRYRIKPDGTMKDPSWLEFKRFPLVRDFALTPRWEIYPLSPAGIDISNVLAGKKSPVDGIFQKPHKALEWLFIDRDDNSNFFSVNAEPRNVLRVVNAWEESERCVIIDALTVSDMPDGSFWRKIFAGVDPGTWPRPQLTRYKIDVNTHIVSWRRLHEAGFHSPMVPEPLLGKFHPNVWMISTSPKRDRPYPSAISRWDNINESLTLRDYYPDLPGEPRFVVDSSGMSPGWILSIVYRVATDLSDLVVLDARTLQEIAVVPLPRKVPPLGGHCWVPLA